MTYVLGKKYNNRKKDFLFLKCVIMQYSCRIECFLWRRISGTSLYVTGVKSKTGPARHLKQKSIYVQFNQFRQFVDNIQAL